MPRAGAVAGRTSLAVKPTTRRVGESRYDKDAIRRGLEAHGARTGKGGATVSSKSGQKFIRDRLGRFA